MKTLLSLFLVFCVGAVQAQKVIALDPATVTFASVTTNSNMDNLEFEVKEDFFNQFISNPIKFVETNFDFKSLGIEDYDEVEVSFITRKGYLKATYDEKGELVKTSQNFKQIRLPRSVWEEIFKEHQGWSLVSNQYTATGKGNKVNKELYRIKLEKGKEIKKLKIIPKPLHSTKVAASS